MLDRNLLVVMFIIIITVNDYTKQYYKNFYIIKICFKKIDIGRFFFISHFNVISFFLVFPNIYGYACLQSSGFDVRNNSQLLFYLTC